MLVRLVLLGLPSNPASGTIPSPEQFARLPQSPLPPRHGHGAAVHAAVELEPICAQRPLGRPNGAAVWNRGGTLPELLLWPTEIPQVRCVSLLSWSLLGRTGTERRGNLMRGGRRAWGCPVHATSVPDLEEVRSAERGFANVLAARGTPVGCRCPWQWDSETRSRSSTGFPTYLAPTGAPKARSSSCSGGMCR